MRWRGGVLAMMLVATSSGVAALVTGIVLYVVGGNTKSASAFTVRPTFGPRFAGLALGASF
jgi:hypothetical protein